MQRHLKISTLLFRLWTWMCVTGPNIMVQQASREATYMCTCVVETLALRGGFNLSINSLQVVHADSKWLRLPSILYWHIGTTWSVCCVTLWVSCCLTALQQVISAWILLKNHLAQIVQGHAQGVVCNNGDFTFRVSVCQLVIVCPGYDRELLTPSAGDNDL